MAKPDTEIFISLVCLQSQRFTTEDFLKNFLPSAKNRPRDFNEYAKYLKRFRHLNQKALSFLDITCTDQDQDARPGYEYRKAEGIILRAGKYAGMIPIRSPYTGLYSGYIQVKAPYEANTLSVLPLLGDARPTQWEPSLPIELDVPGNAPILMECVNYLKAFDQAIKTPWQKFHVANVTQRLPHGDTDWSSYARQSFEPALQLQFNNRLNLLTTDHPQWRQLTHVLQLVLNELAQYALQHDTGRILNLDMRNHLARYAAQHPQMHVDKFHILNADPRHITALKTVANRILQRHTNQRCAWRIDHAQFFERYCQYICRCVANKVGAQVSTNLHLEIHSIRPRPAWMLKYLEPDILLRKSRRTVVLDAKYKSHMLNTDAASLKETFAPDLHQVLGYAHICSNDDNPTIILLYPWVNRPKENETSEQKAQRLIYRPQSSVTIPAFGGRPTALHCLGIPIDKDSIPVTVNRLIELCAFK